MSQAAKKLQRYTYGDLMEWDDGIRYELYDGIPVAMASPSYVHQLIVADLVRQFGDFLIGKPCAVYPSPLDVRLFDTDDDRPEDSEYVVQPDLMVICDPSKVDQHGVHGAPDLVIEILSPSTRANDRLRKYKLYEQAGVHEYWIVDPDMKVLLAHTLEDGRYHSPDVYKAGSTVPVGVLEGCSIDLRTVFPE